MTNVEAILMVLDNIIVGAEGILRDINEQDKVFIYASSIKNKAKIVRDMLEK
jgi:hypothetical protein